MNRVRRVHQSQRWKSKVVWCLIEVLKLVLIVPNLGLLLWWHERVDLRLLFQVEVLEVYLTVFYVRFERGSDFLRFNLFDVYVCKPRMLKNLLDASNSSKSFRLVFVQQFFNDVNKVVSVVQTILLLVRENDFGSLNFCEQQVFVFVKEWCHANPHFIYKNSQGPPIDSEVMTCLQDHLWSQILWCSTICPRHTTCVKHFCETKVNDVDVVFVSLCASNQEVVRLDVSMNDSLLVHLFNSLDHLNSNNENGLEVEASFAGLEKIFQRWAKQVHNHHVELLVGH